MHKLHWQARGKGRHPNVDDTTLAYIINLSTNGEGGQNPVNVVYGYTKGDESIQRLNNLFWKKVSHQSIKYSLCGSCIFNLMQLCKNIFRSRMIWASLPFKVCLAHNIHTFPGVPQGDKWGYKEGKNMFQLKLINR